MPNNSSDNNKRRPIDALFGESAPSSASNYIVEPPQPSTTVKPPPLEPTDDTAERAPQTSREFAPSIEPTSATDSYASTLEPASTDSFATTTPPLVSTRGEDPRFLTLSYQIERLYDDVKNQLRDSPATTNFCFDLLLRARQAYERRDYAMAEYYIQSTDAKLKRSAKSVQAARSPKVVLLWLWEIIAIVIGIAIIALSYVPGLTLFNLPIAAEFLILLRALGWGLIGGVIGAMYNLPWFIQFREYDPAYNMNYFARPFVGLLVGAILFLISQAGILAGNIVIGDIKVGPIFLYVFAILAGFKQEYVTEFFDNVMKTIFRAPQPPSGMKTPPK